MSNGYNAKNYFAHGGSELVIGGKLTFLPGAEAVSYTHLDVYKRQALLRW